MAIKILILIISVLLSQPVLSGELMGNLYYTQGWELKRYDFSTRKVAVLFSLAKEIQKQRRSMAGGMAHAGGNKLLIEGLSNDYKLDVYDIENGNIKEIAQGIEPVAVGDKLGHIFFWGVYEDKGKLFSLFADDAGAKPKQVLYVDDLPIGDLVKRRNNEFLYSAGGIIKKSIIDSKVNTFSGTSYCSPLLFVKSGQEVLCKKQGNEFYILDFQTGKQVRMLNMGKGIVQPVSYIEELNCILFRRDLVDGVSSELVSYDLSTGVSNVVGLDVNARLGAAVYLN